MDGEVFTYDGKSGAWVCAISRTHLDGGAFYAVADITYRGEWRCKIALPLTRSTDSDGLEFVRRQCIKWIKKAEARLEVGNLSLAGEKSPCC